MAVFKIAKGLSKDLPVKKTEGYSWITADDGKIYIDFSDVERICIDNIPTRLAQLLEDDQNRVITEGYYYNNNFYMDSAHESQYTPKPNKIYLDFTSRKLYYYENDSYVEVSSSLEIGETADTAYRGDRGKIAYDHSQVTSGNPHQVTKAEIGLNKVENFKAVSTEESQGLTDTEKTYAKANIDLDNVGNFKAVSTEESQGLTDTEKLNARANIGLGTVAVRDAGVSGGIAELDSNGKVLSSQLPSFVDDVIEYTSQSDFPVTGETGKIYVDTTTNLTYRWSGSSYVEISQSIALGETASTAFRGDLGKEAYDHATAKGSAFNNGLYKIATNAEGHVTDATLVVKQDITNLGIINDSLPAETSGTDKSLVTTGEKAQWNEKTTVEGSSNNGNIIIDGVETTVYTHPGSGTNPHGTTKQDLGLENVGNFKAVSTEANQGLTNTEQENARTNIGAGTSSFSGVYNDLTGKPTLGTASEKDVASSGNASSTQVVMGNDSRLTDSRNAKDVYSWAKESTKPSYIASEVGAIATTLKGAANGVAELDANGKVPSTQLPSYVDDVLEYNGMSSFPTTGETGKIYVDTSTNKTYRWGGSSYVEISPSLALGENSSTAYRGDRGKTAYDHSQKTSGNPHNVTKSDVGLGNVGNFKAVSTVASQGLSSTEQSNARANIGAGTSSFSGSYNDLSNKPTIPSKTSQLTNDSGFITTDTNTHRPIQVNGTEVLGNNTTALNLKAGSNVSLSNSSGTITIAATDTNTWRGISDAVNSTSSDVSASSKAVKTAYDLAASKTSNTGTVTKVTAGTGLTGGNITTTGTIALATSGVTAGSAGPTAAVTGNNNTTVAIPRITVDTYGRVTALTSYNLTNVNTDNDTKNTAGSTDTSSKIFLVGATSQAANPQTYSDNEVFATSGVLTTKSVQIGGGTATMQFNNTTKSIDFIFA